MPEPTPTPPAPTPPAPNPLEAQIAELREAIKKLTPGNPPAPTPTPSDLDDKVKKDAADKAKKESESADLEAAMKFTLRSGDFLKENAAILPKDIADIFAQAEKEKYDSAIHKSNAVKAAIIKSYFSFEANVAVLTASQKSRLEEYLKLTNTVREERAQSVYENIFEPSLEVVKQGKKAAELNKAKNGYGSDTDAEKAYKDKLINGAKKHFLGENKS